MYGIKFFLAVILSSATLVAVGDEAADGNVFGKWRIAVGGVLNMGVKSHLSARNLPQPVSRAAAMVAADETEEAAWGRALNHQYDGGGFIEPDSLNDGYQTENWGLPVSAYKGNGRFVLDNAYKSASLGTPRQDRVDLSDDETQFGVMVEVSREIWSKNPDEDHRWGVDFVADFAYFFQKNAYSERGSVTRDDALTEGVVRTEVNDRAATYDYDTGWDSPVGGMMGHGSFDADYTHPSLLWENVGRPRSIDGGSRTVTASSNYSASGDYQEVEMLFMLRPWYEITDWWRVHGNVGVGVSWGRLSTSFAGTGVSYNENFDQWDCYGVAGLGTVVRYDSYDLSLDFLGRFLRDDLEVEGRHVNGTLERADWCFRAMLGYEF